MTSTPALVPYAEYRRLHERATNALRLDVQIWEDGEAASPSALDFAVTVAKVTLSPSAQPTEDLLIIATRVIVTLTTQGCDLDVLAAAAMAVYGFED